MSQNKRNGKVFELLSTICGVLAVLGILMFFVNILIASILIGLSAALGIVLSKTPQGQIELKIATAKNQATIAKNQEQAQIQLRERQLATLAEQQRLEGLNQKMQHLCQNPENEKLRDEMVSSLTSEKKPDAYVMRSVGLELFRLYPINAEIRKVVIMAAQRSMRFVPKPTDFRTEEIYDLCLDLLEKNPGDSKMKALVLEVGRWHFGKLRGGSPTIYDEQAIQNDILVRSK